MMGLEGNPLFWASFWKSESEVAQSCPTLCDPMNCSLPASPSMGFSRQGYWSGLPFSSPVLLENQMTNSKEYYSQSDQLKAALVEKHLELVNRKYIIFHQDNTRLLFLWLPGNKCYSFAGKVLIHLLHSPGTVFMGVHLFQPLQDCLNWKKSQSTPTVGDIQNSSLLSKTKSFGKMEKVLGSCLKNGRKLVEQNWILCSIKSLVKMKTVSFTFTSETEGTVLPTQYLTICMYNIYEKLYIHSDKYMLLNYLLQCLPSYGLPQWLSG